MLKLLKLNTKVTSDDGSKNIGKMALLGAGCVVTVAGVGYLSYKLYSYIGNRSRPSSVKGGSHSEPTAAKLATDPLSIATQLKGNGNALFKDGKYEEAKECYTQAIENCPAEEAKTLAILYQNRAASNDALQQWLAVISDCDAAILRDAKYQKAYTRRGKANLALDRLEEGVHDTACGFYLQSEKKAKPTQELFEQALAKKSQSDCAELMEGRDPVPLGDDSVRAYVQNFPSDPVLSVVKELSTPADGQERTPFQVACANLVAKKYNDVIAHLNEELEREDSPYVKQTLLLRATFLTLAGCPTRAENDLNRLLGEPELDTCYKATALLRRGLLEVAKMNTKQGLADMKEAVELDPTNIDLYHHRGQISLLMQDVDQSRKDTAKALELQEQRTPGHCNPSLLFQQYMCDLQVATVQSDVDVTISNMEAGCAKYPQDGECWCLYTQALIYFGRFPEAEQVYTKAVTHLEDNPRIFIQRAAMVLSWKKDSAKANEYLSLAKKADPYCEAVYENLALMHLQKGELEEAIEQFRLQLKYSRTTLDCQNTLAMIESIEVQLLMKRMFEMTVGNFFNTFPSYHMQ